MPAEVKLGREVQRRWDGDVYRVVTEDGQLTIDTAKRKGAATDKADPTWDTLHRPAQYHRLAGGDYYLTVFSESDKQAMRTNTRLELQVPEQKKR